MTTFYVNNETSQQVAIKAIQDRPFGDFGYGVEILAKQRTLLQNAALYKYFELLAISLNDGGLEIHMEYLGKEIDVPWNKDSVKERLWRPIQEALYGTKSTTKLETDMVGKVYEVLNRHLASAHGIFVPFPEQEKG